MFSLIRKKPEAVAPQSFATPSKDSVARIAVTENGQIAYASEEFLKLSRLTPNEAQTKTFSEVVRFERNIDTINKIKQGIHNVHINGHTEPFQFHFDWVTAPNAQRYLIGSKAQNTTQNENKKAAPLISRTQIEKLLNLTHDIALISDALGGILHINTAFSKKLGFDKNEAIEKTFVSLFCEEDRPYIRNTVQSFMLESREITGTQDTPIDFEGRIETKNNETLWMRWRITEHDGLFYASGQDVTGIKNQEKALERHEKQLLQAENLGRMGHWRWVLDEDEIEWSQEIYRIFGVEKGEFEPNLQSMNKMVHRDDIDRVNQALQRAIIEENDYDVEFSIIRPDGEERLIRSEGRCSRNDEGEVTALFGIMQDMTERMLYERELKNAKESAERAYAAKTQFLANMSHELRTPLNAIIGFSEMIERQLLGPIGNEKYLDYIGGIRNSGEHLLDLISDILDMSKIEAGKYELMLEEINITKIIKLAIHMMEGRALDANLKITASEICDESLNIVADRRAVLQILLNLMSTP